MDDDFDLDDLPYEIGYKKPPKQHRFKKGNRAAAGKRGKKRQRSIGDHIRKQLEKRTIVKLDGEQVSMKNSETIAVQLVGKAKRGDLAATRMLVALAGPECIQPTLDIPTSIKVEFVPPNKPKRQERD